MRRASAQDLPLSPMGSRDYQDQLSRQAADFLKSHKKREEGREYDGTSKKKRPKGLTAIYVVATGDFVKIGFSKSPVRRLVVMQVGCPMKLELVAQFDCPRGFERIIESDIHETFEAWRTRGEWFEMNRHTAVSLVARVIELHCRAL
jgi:hypothetical protein